MPPVPINAQFDPLASILAIVVLRGQHWYRVVAQPPTGVGGDGVGFGRGL